MRPPGSLRGAERTLIAAVLAVVLAQGGPAAAAAREGRALQLEVFLNGTSTQLVGAFVEQPDGRLAATRKELAEVGVKPPGTGGDDDLIALADLPGLSYRYDEPRQRIDITASDDRRVPHVVDARGEVPAPGTARAGFGAVLNYTLYGTGVKDADRPGPGSASASAELDGRVFTPWGHLRQTGILRTTLAPDLDVLRLDTTAVHSDPETATTYRAGDAISRGPLWARPIRFGGVQIERNFGLRPDLVTAPLPTVSGSAAVPSTVEVFVDSLRTFAHDVPAGPYSIANLPVLSGSGTARMVLRDASGRAVETSLPFYTSPQLLRPGLFDFSLEAGFPRTSYATRSNAYSERPAGSASGRYGVTDWLTLEAHGEGGAGLFDGGVGLVTNAGALGVLSLAGRGSYFDGAGGFQAYAAFETRLFGVSLSLSSQRTFGAFEDLASVTARFSDLGAQIRQRSYDPTAPDATAQPAAWSARPPRALDRVSIGLPLPFTRTSLGLSYIDLDRGPGDRSRIVAASASQTFATSTSVSVNAFADLGKHKDVGVFVGLSMPLGALGLASLGGASNRNGSYLTADAARALGAEFGDHGWRLRDVEGRDRSYRTAAASYRSAIGRIEAAAEQVGRGGRVGAEAEGAIAVAGSGIFLANRIEDSFAVVDAGAPNVEVFHENRSVGRTGSGGQILIPDLRSYQPNRIAIDPGGLPVDAQIDRTSEVVVPAEKTGLRLDFGIRVEDGSAVVIFHDAHGKPLPPDRTAGSTARAGRSWSATTAAPSCAD